MLQQQSQTLDSELSWLLLYCVNRCWSWQWWRSMAFKIIRILFNEMFKRLHLLCTNFCCFYYMKFLNICH